MKLSEQTEPEQRLRKGDAQVLEEILRTRGPGVLALLRKQFRAVLTEEDLEDVLSIGLFRLWTSRDSYDSCRSSLGVWFFRICENAARDVLRFGWQKARRLEVDHRQLDGAVSSASESDGSAAEHDAREPPTDAQSPTALQQTIREILEDLPEAQRFILLSDAAARDDVACSQRLGEELHLPSATIRVYRKRALERMRNELLKRGWPLEPAGPP